MDGKSNRYVQAAYEAVLGGWLEDLRQARQALIQAGLMEGASDPTVPFEVKQQRIDGVLSPRLDPKARNLLYILARDNALNQLPTVIAELEDIERGEVRKSLTAEVTSAVALTDEEKQTLQRKLQTKSPDALEITYRVQPEILGGLILRVGDKVIDGSVATRLESLKTALRTGR
ncbi:MAG: ATP synthase F1 subunit delta [Chloroflexi bacterium]|nr:ATP synthase F1 subunit delta [Chloroflexota bacterium]